ncbi:MAG: GAF domain-containing protein [Chloroflexi bacterium]|nr:GAF domain-containing protein [Chloroflexota bacterium]
MSKKQLHSRLENLFSDLANESIVPPEGQTGPAAPPQNPEMKDQPTYGKPAHLVGWAWEVDADLNYVYCGPEVSDALRMNPAGFLGKSILTYGLHPASKPSLEAAFHQDSYPIERDVLFENRPDNVLPLQIHIQARLEENGRVSGWRGFARRIAEEDKPKPAADKSQPAAGVGDGRKNGSSQTDLKAAEPEIHQKKEPAGDKPFVNSPPAQQPVKKGTDQLQPIPRAPKHGFAFDQGALKPAMHPWTDLGKRSLNSSEIGIRNASGSDPAAIAVPLQMQGVGDLLLEIVDDSGDRDWTDDDRQLVTEVASQLALALDNAQLYMSVQQELTERIRAEEEILRRNKDLATLNQIGQQLNRLTTREEIFELLSSMIGEVLDNSNLSICSYDSDRQILSFPIYRRDGQPVEAKDAPFGNGLHDHVIRTRSTLLIRENAAQQIKELGIGMPRRVPASLLGIPMVAGDRVIGAIVIQDFDRERAFDQVHAELLSTAAAQAATALENADLFQQMQSALEAIENRERYQANVARAAAILTEFGTQSMPEVLKALGQAAQCSRVYFAQYSSDERGGSWSATADWNDPDVAYLFDKSRLSHMAAGDFPNWTSSLKEKGWVVTTASDESSPEVEFLNAQHIRSTLLLAVAGSSSTPHFLAFDQLGHDRAWLNEEINSLRVAADAIANTFVREGLLEQLQLNLDETEGLYKASNRLALANDMQEMVTAVLSGVRSPDINRALLLLFEQDNFGKLTQITVGASWYSGKGTPPPPIGTEFDRAAYERFLQTSTPVFYEDILDAQLDSELQEQLVQQNIRGLAVLPLWSGKRQIGVLLLQSEARHHFTGRETRTYPPLVDQMATAVENQRLFEQTQKALAETELLYGVSHQIAQASSAQDMLGLVVENVLPAGADRASLVMIENDEQGELVNLEVVGAYDYKGWYQEMGLHLPVASMPLVKSLTDEPLIIQDVDKHPLDEATRSTLKQFGVAAGCFIPLRTSGRLMGVLNATSSRPVQLTQEDTRLMRVVGNGIAVALEKQRLLRQAERRALELQTASEIARDTASTLSLDLLLSRIVTMLHERFNLYHAAVFLLDETNKYALIREAAGEAGDALKQRGLRIAVGSHSVVGIVTSTGEPYILADLTGSPMHNQPELLVEAQAEMGIPLKLGSTIIGALDLQSRQINAFKQDDVMVMQILADQIAIAIENARAYELSQKAIEDMKEIDRVKSQFLANMSHELRTPLNSIIGFSRVILKGIDGPINEIQQQDLTAIYNSGQHLLSLINDILDLSKIEAGKMELSISEFNVADMINSAMSTAVGLVKDKPIKLETVIADNLPNVRADNTRARQVLINFLSNAAKFTDEGTILVEAMPTTSPTGKSEVMISVTDSGPGIAPQDQSKLFLPFSQVDDSPTRKTGGTGLGLSICRSLIDMHGGRIGLLRSELGVGSTFYFTLPAVVPEPPAEQEESAPVSNKILAIDDDPRVTSLYERYLKPHGFQVIPLANPKQAVERVKEVKPFAVTLDIMMPEKDGWQVMRDLKNCPETRDIPIIVCSILEDQEKGFSMGAADYLVKPFLQEELLNAINRLNQGGEIREVLVIDDDLDDLRLVQKMLEDNQNYHVMLAQGGREGWDAIQANQPDVVILDLFMPEMNGFTILQNLRTHSILRHTPVIVLTGADLTAEQLEQLNEFGQGVLTKGYLREKDLLLILEETLRRYQPATN